MSDESRRNDGRDDEAPAELDEARAGRELAEAMEGKGAGAPDEEALAAAATVAAARRPELSDEARAKIGDALFGPAVVVATPSRRGWAIAAGVLVAVGSAATLMVVDTAKHAPSSQASPAHLASHGFHAKAELLLAEMMPQPTAAERAQAIADRARARLNQEAAP